MSYYFTSDLHLGHTNIIKYANRPFKDADEMNEAIIRNWNSVVTENDTVFVLGDVVFFSHEDKIKYVLNRLNGIKRLIWGNHDRKLHKIWQKYFLTVNDILTVNVPPELNNGKKGQEIVCCHYAMRVWNKSHYGAYHLYGHSHGTLPDDSKALSCDVGVDCWNFTPVSMQQINKHMSKKTFKPIDHHGKK